VTEVIQVRDLEDPASVFEQMVEILCSMTRVGLVHCDFNEFNVMLCDDGRLIAIDFPQMVSVSHANAKMLFERDLNCTIRFFTQKLKFNLETDSVPCWEDLLQEIDAKNSVDVELHASGFNNVEHDITEIHSKQQQDGCSGAESDGDRDALGESICASKVQLEVTKGCSSLNGEVGTGNTAAQCCTSGANGDTASKEAFCSDSTDTARVHEVMEAQCSQVLSEEQVCAHYLLANDSEVCMLLVVHVQESAILSSLRHFRSTFKAGSMV
jgi:RIO kinase 2